MNFATARYAAERKMITWWSKNIFGRFPVSGIIRGLSEVLGAQGP